MIYDLYTIAAGITSGLFLGILIFWASFRFKKGTFQSIADQILNKAKLDADSLIQKAEIESKKKYLEQKEKIDTYEQKINDKFLKERERLKNREDTLENRLNLIEQKLTDLAKQENSLAAKREQLESELLSFNKAKDQLYSKLEKISGLTKEDAVKELKEEFRLEIAHEMARYIEIEKKQAKQQADKKAQSIIATSINRLAVSCVSESTVTTVPFKSDDIKRRIIGREGRNIRTLEKLTGINFIVDDASGVVTLSGFDPIRVNIAKISLKELIADGRIHPTRIEEVVDSAKEKIKESIKSYGHDAAIRTGQVDLDPKLIELLGKLNYRSSYGQNVLEHSIEVSYILGIMAAELGLNVNLAKRIGLLHDIGKAVTHEVDGTHAVIGHDFALQYGEAKEVANGIGCHHNEMVPISIEGSLCGAADAISASRPGARVEAIAEYVKRLKKLEDLAYQFPGVEKAYAMQAGKEIRVSVLPDMIDDSGMIHLARDLTKKIENELHYTGKIKITVIRERKAVEYAI